MKYYNVTQEEIEKKLFNIFVGISLGNKLLTPELAKHYVKWAHAHTKDDALILIADEIDIINWQVFRNMKQEEAREKVQQKSYGVAGMFEKAKRNLYKDENDPSYITKVHTIFWDDIKNEGFEHLKMILTEEYTTNESFKKQILFFVQKYAELRDVGVTAKKMDTLASYIINELPTLLGGVYWNKTLYNLILYPTYIESGMSQFVIDIRNGKYFDASKLQLRQLCVLVEDFLEDPKEPKHNE